MSDPLDLTPAMMMRINAELNQRDDEFYAAQVRTASQYIGKTDAYSVQELQEMMRQFQIGRRQRERYFEIVNAMLGGLYKDDRKRRFLELLFLNVVRNLPDGELVLEFPDLTDTTPLEVGVETDETERKFVVLTEGNNETSTGSGTQPDTGGSPEQELLGPGIPDVVTPPEDQGN
jgi:hypothetical protein